MKKILLAVISLVVIIFLTFILVNNREKDTNLTKIKVAEVAHSVFYAPQYVADKLGFFEEQGLDVEIILTPGADKVSAAVLSGDVEIGFSGSEATIYIYNSEEEDYLVTFAGLTKRDGSFIVSRVKEDNFKLSNLKGKTIIGGRIGGMPEMTLEWSLKEAGIDPKKDLVIDTSIAFASMAGAFIGGLGDYVALFEPQALQLEKEGVGYVVASLGEYGGVVPYTSYYTKKSYLNNNPEVIEKFNTAIQKGLDFVHNNTSEDIAKEILDHFPDTSLSDLTKIVERYKQNDSWFKTTYIEQEDFNHIQEIMINAGELNTIVPYEELVNNSYNKKTK